MSHLLKHNIRLTSALGASEWSVSRAGCFVTGKDIGQEDFMRLVTQLLFHSITTVH